MTGVRLQADKRFRRARVQPFPKRSVRVPGRALRLVLALSAVAAGVYFGPELPRPNELLRVDHVVVMGNRNILSGDVEALLAGLHGASILEVDLAAYRQQLLKSGWVRAAMLRRLLPATIEVTIAEREPVGLFRIAAQLYLVDSAGTVIDKYRPQFAELRLPVIDGLDSRNPRDSPVDGARTQLAARLVAALAARPDLAALVSQIDVTDEADAVVLLSGDPTLLHLGDQRFVERLDRYLELGQALRRAVPEIDYVDLRYDRRVYVRPAGSGYTQ